MKERPILFSGPMVRALLAGRKTQTRRLVKPQPPHWMGIQPMWGRSPDGVEVGDKWLWRAVGPDYPDGDDDDLRCPYGVPGDQLWVRERCYEGTHSGGRPWVRYHSDDNLILPPGTRWRPSIHMHRWASRILLTVTDVRAQRLHAIDREDAAAEGVPQTAGEAHVLGLFDMSKEPGHEWDNRTTVENYARLWDRINGLGSWSANPWVWAVTFRVSEPVAVAPLFRRSA